MAELKTELDYTGRQTVGGHGVTEDPAQQCQHRIGSDSRIWTETELAEAVPTWVVQPDGSLEVLKAFAAVAHHRHVRPNQKVTLDGKAGRLVGILRLFRDCEQLPADGDGLVRFAPIEMETGEAAQDRQPLGRRATRGFDHLQRLAIERLDL